MLSFAINKIVFEKKVSVCTFYMYVELTNLKMPLKLLNFAIQNKLVDFHQNCCQTNLHVYIKGWKQTCSTCYWIKKQIEHFPHSPLDIYNSVSQNHLIWEKSNKSSWWHFFFKSETVTSQSISKAKHVSAASFTLYSYVFYRFFLTADVHRDKPIAPSVPKEQ